MLRNQDGSCAGSEPSHQDVLGIILDVPDVPCIFTDVHGDVAHVSGFLVDVSGFLADIFCFFMDASDSPADVSGFFISVSCNLICSLLYRNLVDHSVKVVPGQAAHT